MSEKDKKNNENILKDVSIKPMTLNEVELTEFKKFDALKTSAASLEKLLNLKMENLTLKESQSQLILKDIGHQRKDIIDDRSKLSKERADLQKKYEDFVESVRKRLKIKGNFGYNPETAEVILDESK